MLIGNYFKNINFKFKNHFFSGLSFDSSACKKNYIFFAIKGNHFDGSKFINHSIKKGARTIVSSNKYEGIKNNVLFIRSSNVRKLLSEVSSKIYNKKPKNLIAVTGTNGKSSIVNFYLQILKFNKKKSCINRNSRDSCRFKKNSSAKYYFRPTKIKQTADKTERKKYW